METSSSHEAERWLRQATDDLTTAERLAELEIHYASCFYAQQAAEKALKAVLFHFGAESVRGHSVVELGRLAGEREPSFAEMAKKLGPLDAYYIPTRYPNGLPGGVASDVYQREDSERALRLARAAVESAARVLPGGSAAE